jgi:ElaB/YqjD/DUF883 family membrane-anchored ribosome-binding protein
MSTDTPKSPGDPEEKAAPESPRSGSARSVGQTSRASGDQHSQKTDEIRERAREVQDRIEEGYHELEQRYDDARNQLRGANDSAVTFIRENPVLCLVGAVGVGYFVGRLASRRWLT